MNVKTLDFLLHSISYQMFQNTYSSCQIIVIFPQYLKFFSKTREESSPNDNAMMSTLGILDTGQQRPYSCTNKSTRNINVFIQSCCLYTIN